jgi:hypothetical protein
VPYEKIVKGYEYAKEEWRAPLLDWTLDKLSHNLSHRDLRKPRRRSRSGFFKSQPSAARGMERSLP